MLADEQISELRSHFPILREKTYLYNCSQGALGDAVEAGMRKYAASWRTSAAPWEEWMEHSEALRGVFARFINAEPEEIAIVTSASSAINPIANALRFDGRNKVVLSEYELPSRHQQTIENAPLTGAFFFCAQQRIYESIPADEPRSRLELYRELILHWRRQGRSYRRIRRCWKNARNIQSLEDTF